jgi:hypothetical protein
MDYLFDSYIDMTSIIVLIWAAMADIKFHGDVMFLFVRVVVVVVAAKVFSTNGRIKCSVPRTYVENINFSGKFFSAKTKFWAKLRPRAQKTSAGSLFWPKNFNFATHKHTKSEVFV